MTSFYILTYIKTPRGFESFARFYVGNKNELARHLFDKLKGSREKIDDCVLQMDLMETQNNLPVNIKVIGFFIFRIRHLGNPNITNRDNKIMTMKMGKMMKKKSLTFASEQSSCQKEILKYPIALLHT